MLLHDVANGGNWIKYKHQFSVLFFLQLQLLLFEPQIISKQKV